ncbi:PDR/VanB family oxidoreductase [Ottowia thiooxydans]|uniref:Ferredoxin-NADP reductase n=1 Tax=Ottowia thiooxydans TaxID=219182 RepID=A0ABV2Q8Y7_9BURK
MNKIRVSITERVEAAKDVVRLKLRKADGENLPVFTPGSHIDVFLPNGLLRQYSLLNDCRELGAYEIAVSKAAASRGGSSCVHADLKEGGFIDISEPRNNFSLRIEHRKFQFVAGGIGITPILSMIRYCESQGWDWSLLYLARSRAHAAFQDELRAIGGTRVRWHFDDEAGKLFDFTDPSFAVQPGVPIYCCGPTPVMLAVEQYSNSQPNSPAYFEWFAPPAVARSNEVVDTVFRVKLHRSDKLLVVPESKSILDVLQENGYDLPCSCREGMCRTCETIVLDGVPDHRDYVLSNAEKESGRTMMVCVSRAHSDTLVLDI